MDPNANLEEQKKLSEWLLQEKVEHPDFVRNAVRLAELVAALDEWISKGGFLPNEWIPS